MSENRTVLGYISKHILANPAIAFPEVRAWIVESGKVAKRPLVREFPESGTVFLHASAAGGNNPPPDHYGIFECQPPESHSERKNWRVVSTDETIAQLISVGSTLNRSLDFYSELDGMKDVRLANVFLGHGRFYFLTQDDWIVGPYTFRNGAVMAATEKTQRWKKTDADLLESGEWELTFVSARSLGTGIIFPPTLQDAIRRVLKVVGKNGRCAFLSRQHITELAQCMTDVSFADELSWFISGMNHLLTGLKDTLEASDVLTHELLGNPAIGSMLEARWRAEHSQKVDQAESELHATTTALEKAETSYKEVVRLTTELSQTSAELQEAIASQTKAAQSAFQAEIARLAADPSQIAIFSALLSPQSSVAPQQVNAPRLWREMVTPLPSTGEVAVRGLLSAGLTVRCAYELTTAALAGFLSGQTVSICNPLAALLAEAFLNGAGRSSYWSCEVPAGLLEPLPAPPNAAEQLGLVFHGANRSDFGLIVAGIRAQQVRQMAGGTPPSVDVVFTLDETDALVVAQPLPVGPCLNSWFLSFSDSPSQPDIKPFPPRNAVAIPALPTSDFEEMFPDLSAKLQLFKNEFSVVMARRYCAALENAGCEAARVRELFIKYWLLPRLTCAEIAEFLKTESALCDKDAQLAALRNASTDE